MKAIVQILIFVLICSNSFGKKIVTSFEVMVDQASHIVMGEIITVDSTSYSFKVNHLIAGKLNSDTILVNKFQVWQCDPRIEYQAGQRSILFLLLRGDNFYTINGGSGEILYEHEDSLYIEDYKYASFLELKNGKIPSEYLVNLKTFVKAIQKFKSCVDFGFDGTEDVNSGIYPFAYKLECAELEDGLLRNNDFYMWLLSRLKNYQRI